MSGYYVYLISSIPMLHFGAKPPFSYGRFLEICQGMIPDEEIAILKGIASMQQAGYVYGGRQPALKEWYAFETTLRNELVKIRAGRKKIDPGKYLRREGYAEPSVTHLSLSAYRDPSLLEGEKILDEERWRFLEGLSIGHYFDIDSLVIYALKLLILERWERIRSSDKQQLVEEVLPKG
jgi:hypothetical protein